MCFPTSDRIRAGILTQPPSGSWTYWVQVENSELFLFGISPLLFYISDLLLNFYNCCRSTIYYVSIGEVSISQSVFNYTDLYFDSLRNLKEHI